MMILTDLENQQSGEVERAKSFVARFWFEAQK